MYRLTKIFLLLTPFFLISCLDVVEEIDLNNNKGGKATYTFNASQSKIKLSTLLKLDSIDGYKIPKLYEVEQELKKAVLELNSKKGISGANYIFNKEAYILTLNLNFTSIYYLDDAIRTLSYWNKSNWKPSQAFYTYKSNRFKKITPVIAVKEKDLKEVEKRKETLQEGSYVFILRNSDGTLTPANTKLRLSGNKKAVLFRENLYELTKYRNGFNLEVEVK